MTLGELLRTWRKASGKTQVEVCAELGYSSSGTVSLHETNDAAPSAEALARYVDVYGRSRDDLVTSLLLLAGVGGDGGIGPCIPAQDDAQGAEASL